MSIEVKGQLAKLLATEDLLIEHRKVSTASFDVKNRVLTLPIWKDLDGNVYDLLVGHEVAHALYTPVNWNVSDIPHSYLNIVEDARIERLIQQTYPGLRHSFFKGYQQLWKKDFFEVNDRDIHKLPLIDRINLQFKIGDYLLLDFNADEKVFLDAIASAQSYEDVVRIARDIYEYSKQQKEKEQQNQEVPAPSGSEGNSPTTPSEPEIPTDSSEDSESTPEDDTSTEDSEERYDGPKSGQGGTEEGSTDSALAENLERLLDKNSRETNYCTIPEYNLDHIILDYKEILNEFKKSDERLSNYYDHELHSRMKEYADRKLKQFRDNSLKTVNYLVKEFEAKKAAEGYARRSVSRTGVLDMSKLHTHKWNEDVFKKITSIPDAKNHGMIFFLDWSGSMNAVLKETGMQVLNLVWFCRKVGIPFEVYAFTEGMDYGYSPDYSSNNIKNVKEGDLFISDSMRLYNFFSSRATKKEFEEGVTNFWRHISCSTLECRKLALGGTPLADTILMTPDIVKKFKKMNNVQKISCVYLSDGESCMLRRSFVREREVYNRETNEHEVQEVAYGRQLRGYDRTILRSRNYTAELNTTGCEVTRSCIDYVRNLMPDVTMLGVRLIDKRSISWYLSCLGMSVNKSWIDAEWKKNRSLSVSDIGYHQVYMLPCDKSLGDDTEQITVNTGASKAQLTKAFKKHMGSKMTNKKILTNFISQIA